MSWRNPIVLSAAIALIVRLSFGAILLSRGAEPVRGDARYYEALAQELRAGSGLASQGRPTAFVVPGFPIFLAGIHSVFGPAPGPVLACQFLLGALTAGAAARIASQIGGRTAGTVSGLLVALNPHLVEWSTYVLTETLFIALAVGVLWLLVEAQQRRSLAWFAAAGLAIGAAALTRPAILAFGLVAVLLAGALSRAGRRMLTSLTLLAGIGLFVAPWVARNALTVGVPTLATESANVLWLGYNPNTREHHANGYVSSEPLPERIDPGSSEADVYRAYLHAAGEFLASHPYTVVTYAPHKIWNMWRPVFGGSRIHTWIFIGGSYLLLLALGGIGVWVAQRRQLSSRLLFLHAYVFVLSATHALLIGEIRYRMPVEPVLAIYAGLGAAHIVGHWRDNA